jgi:hypothetical protein
VLGAIELEVDVREDGMTRLPGVPAGRARVLVLLPDHEKAAPEKRSLGLPFGLDRGKIRVADDFDVLPEDIRAAFEGNGT